MPEIHGRFLAYPNVILPVTAGIVTKKTRIHHKIWQESARVTRDFAYSARYSGYQLSLNHLTALRSDRAG